MQELTHEYLLEEQEKQVARFNEIFENTYDPAKRCRIDLRWYGHPISNNPKVQVDVIVVSRKLKDNADSPPDMLFRTHIYEFKVSPTQEFIDWMGSTANYFVELQLYKVEGVPSSKKKTPDDEDIDMEEEDSKMDYNSTTAREYHSSPGKRVVTFTFQEDTSSEIPSWTLCLNWPEDKTKIAFRGEFFFKFAMYRRTDEDVYRRLFAKISSRFKILSKPGVFLSKKRPKDGKPPPKRTRKSKDEFSHEPPEMELVPKPPTANIISAPVSSALTTPLRTLTTLSSVFAQLPPMNNAIKQNGPPLPKPASTSSSPPVEAAAVHPKMNVANEASPNKSTPSSMSTHPENVAASSPKKPIPSPIKKQTVKTAPIIVVDSDAKQNVFESGSPDNKNKTKNVFFEEDDTSLNKTQERDLFPSSSLLNQFPSLSPSNDANVVTLDSQEVLSMFTSVVDRSKNSSQKSTPGYKSKPAVVQLRNESHLVVQDDNITPPPPPQPSFVHSPLSMLFSPLSAGRGLLNLNFSQDSQNDSQSRDWDYFAVDRGVQQNDSQGEIKTPMNLHTPTTLLDGQDKIINGANLLHDDKSNEDDKEDFYNKMFVTSK
ncbi:hypothetical protein AKO1_006612 [Acrasis kona]|uniref:Uncharacterized protein n=1 Tax=Acrasis kona TaxID=1008807 RepID=A0AAW2ZL91_9EUKA